MKESVSFSESKIRRLRQIEPESNVEVFLIRLMNITGTPLSQNDRAYFGNQCSQFRHVTGIELVTPNAVGTFPWGNTGLVALPWTTSRMFLMNLVNRQGERIIENMPIGPLWAGEDVLNFPGNKGKIRRFDIEIDVHNSYLTLATPTVFATTTGCIPLKFSFKD